MFPPTPKFILIINAINLTFNYYKIINIIQIFKICTLVTAGLYLLVRSSPILEYSPTALLVITLIGSITAFVAATCGLVQNDIKRIIAFSTISQLGYMVLAVGLSKYDVSLFHVINHAFFIKRAFIVIRFISAMIALIIDDNIAH